MPLFRWSANWSRTGPVDGPAGPSADPAGYLDETTAPRRDHGRDQTEPTRRGPHRPRLDAAGRRGPARSTGLAAVAQAGRRERQHGLEVGERSQAPQPDVPRAVVPAVPR